jgi:hypothetical protein
MALTLENCLKAVEQIKSVAADPEVAHSLEDKLCYEFIAHVAETAATGELQQMAHVILLTQDVDFPRWYA